MRTALIASVVLNVFLMGAAAGGFYSWSFAEATAVPAAIRGGRLRAAGDELAPQPQAAYRQALRQAAVESRPAVIAAQIARMRAAAAFIAPEFDQEAIQAALDEALAADFTVRKLAEKTVLDVVATLPLDQRRVLAEGLHRNGPLRYPQQSPAPR